jgi:hypothetical protein
VVRYWSRVFIEILEPVKWVPLVGILKTLGPGKHFIGPKVASQSSRIVTGQQKCINMPRRPLTVPEFCLCTMKCDTAKSVWWTRLSGDMVVQLFEGTRVVRNPVEQLAGKNSIIVSVALPFHFRMRFCFDDVCCLQGFIVFRQLRKAIMYTLPTAALSRT